MAGDGSEKKPPSIPHWQQQSSRSDAQSPPSAPDTNKPTPVPDLDPLEHARRFLDDETIKNATHERKVAFLESKGLTPEQIEDLLSEHPDANATKPEDDLKTVHDSTSTIEARPPQPQPQQTPVLNKPVSEARITPRSDAPPIITYPEFLLKPQKPPPLVTFERLADAAYILAGVSALTYGASKYLVQPMLESLTDARHDLALNTQNSLSKLNTKLETTVSHVPYIPPLHSRSQPHPDDETESIDSDPTELFHRDIATQTTPPFSRSSSLSSLSPNLSATDSQSSRLTSLHSALKSLLSSTTTHFAEDALSTSLSTLQTTIDNLNTSSSPLDYTSSSTTMYPWQSSSGAKSKTNEQESQAAKFKSEIRALKGAFLSSRNFPTARPAVPFTMPQAQR